MSRYRFELATPADDADLRRVLAETPMPGAITVSFRREPSYFGAAVVDGRFRQVVAARALDDGRVVGFGSRAVGERYVNGQPESIGYLSNLRLLPGHRNRGLVARGYAFFRKLHGDGRTRLYLTTIAEENTVALTVLTSGRGGLPRYHPVGRFLTAALPWSKRNARPAPAGVEIRPARPDDTPALLAFLHAVGPRRQFFPCYAAGDFFTLGGAFRDLEPADLLLALRGGAIVGTLAAWDQHRFRQTVVNAYGRRLAWARPLYNAWARLTGRPGLPRPGDAFCHRAAALPLVAGDDPAVFAALLDALLTRGRIGEVEYLLIGLHEADPLLAVLRRYRARWYTTRLFLVCWEDGEELRGALDGRPPYLELGCL
jgi:hypothetical protein